MQITMVMPNGKLLGEQTKGDLKRLGIIGNKLAAKVPVGKIVSQVMTAKDLAAFEKKNGAF